MFCIVYDYFFPQKGEGGEDEGEGAGGRSERVSDIHSLVSYI